MLLGRCHAKSQSLFMPHMARVAHHTYNPILIQDPQSEGDKTILSIL